VDLLKCLFELNATSQRHRLSRSIAPSFGDIHREVFDTEIFYILHNTVNSNSRQWHAYTCKTNRIYLRNSPTWALKTARLSHATYSLYILTLRRIC